MSESKLTLVPTPPPTSCHRFIWETCHVNICYFYEHQNCVQYPHYRPSTPVCVLSPPGTLKSWKASSGRAWCNLSARSASAPPSFENTLSVTERYLTDTFQVFILICVVQQDSAACWQRGSAMPITAHTAAGGFLSQAPLITPAKPVSTRRTKWCRFHSTCFAAEGHGSVTSPALVSCSLPSACAGWVTARVRCVNTQTVWGTEGPLVGSGCSSQTDGWTQYPLQHPPARTALRFPTVPQSVPSSDPKGTDATSKHHSWKTARLPFKAQPQVK